MKKFVVVGTQRSGTTYIRHCLNSHPEILCDGELFLKKFPHQSGYFQYIKSLPFGRLRHALLRPLLINTFLDRYYQQPGCNAIGFKLMYSEVRWLPYACPHVMSYIKKHEISVIHIIRENILKTLISREVARTQNVYHAKSSIEIKKIRINTNTLLKGLGKIKRENEWWAEQLSGGDYMSVTYEEFVADKDSISKQMLSYLSIDNYHELGSSNVKITSDNLKDVVENYTDIINLLKHTEFSYCL